MILYKTIFEIAAGDREAVREALAVLRAAALETPGCRGFEAIEKPFEPGILTVVEEWADAESVKVYEASEAVAAFFRATGHLVQQQGPTSVIEVGASQTLYAVPLTEHEGGITNG